MAARLTYIFYKVRDVVLTSLISFLIGIALLVGGRRLFWLFVGALGFIAGLQFAGLFPQISEATSIIIGLLLGIVFAVLAIFLQRLAVGIAGFLARLDLGIANVDAYDGSTVGLQTFTQRRPDPRSAAGKRDSRPCTVLGSGRPQAQSALCAVATLAPLC